MRIAYGIMGYGRGHAIRSSAILPELLRQHDVKVYAGPDAYEVLKEDFDCQLIPCIHYRYGKQGKIDPWKTIRANINPTADLLFRGERTLALEKDWQAFQPELVISDSEAWAHQLARSMSIPRISLDHVGVMAYCKPRFPAEDLLLAQRDRWGYLSMMGVPDYAIVSSFYRAPARYRNVKVVGPILRDMVYQATPKDDGYLMAYFNKGQYQFSDSVEQALRACGHKVVVYGTGREGIDENLHFKRPSQLGFVDDMAGATAMIATAGHQMISECIWLEKPMLLLPEEAVEQRLNAYQVESMGMGEQTKLNELSGYDIERFLRRREEFVDNIRRNRRDGRAEALDILHKQIECLSQARPTGLRRTMQSATQIFGPVYS